MLKTGILLLAVAGVLSACNKSTPATADSTIATSSTAGGPGGLDKDAARAEIMRADSAWLRGMMSKNVDSIMPFYSPDIVSMSEGMKVAKGTNEVRSAYTEMVKSNMRNPAITFGGIEFSDDGSMAYDHGTFTGTIDGPNKKPMQISGDYLNVWKKSGGKWLMVAEISNSNKPGM